MRKLTLILAALCAFASASAEPIKLRAVEFRTVAVAYAGPDGKPGTFDLHYADLIRQVVLTPAPQGASADDVVKTVEVWSPIKRAIEAKEKRVLLNDADYQFLLAKLNAFRWSPLPDLTEPVATFIAYLRGLKEEEFEAAPKK